MTDDIGGRTFFTNARRSLVDEDEIQLVSVGIDIGSSTSHCAFSRVTLERIDTRYVVAAREVLFESDILLTPYSGGNSIDTAVLDRFLKAQYAAAGIGFDQIDTGALILTGTAVRRRNARAIADLFAEAAGKFVSVSAGDAMEAVLAAFGSGAAGLSAATGLDVLNVDIGGGTTKVARCVGGEVVDLTAIDIGARILAVDGAGSLNRIEPAGRRIALDCGVEVEPGIYPTDGELDRIADRMADHLIATMAGGDLGEATSSLLRLAPLRTAPPPAIVTFSGGVSEYVYARTVENHGDLGPRLATRIAERTRAWGPDVRTPRQGIRATVIGASQYTVQISGSTIFVSDLDVLPLRNLPTILPRLTLADETIRAGTGIRRGPGGTRSLRASRPDPAGRHFLPLDGIGDVPAARHVLPRRGGRVRRTHRRRLPDRADRQQRCRRSDRCPLPRGNAHRGNDRVDRRHRPAGIRLRRYRIGARGIGIGPRHHQIARVPRHRQAWTGAMTD